MYIFVGACTCTCTLHMTWDQLHVLVCILFDMAREGPKVYQACLGNLILNSHQNESSAPSCCPLAAIGYNSAPCTPSPPQEQMYQMQKHLLCPCSVEWKMHIRFISICSTIWCWYILQVLFREYHKVRAINLSTKFLRLYLPYQRKQLCVHFEDMSLDMSKRNMAFLQYFKL